MAKISLRNYNQEIETMVENRQLDEAIAHCRHILNTYPKNLETYRLLGKAYLEAKSYDEAINIFQRVVMAVPGDFVSHVGMSIINDEQNKLDDAIWHMERAFESQPSNAAIQAELQRLYGRRDGVEPPKIRLTRGALAHMYVQGELYPQAISEISSVLEEDPERLDMQDLLARAYFHSGQKSEAAEICSSLLLQYPYNLDANRILVELLPESERTESNQVYRHRINELDPYATFATGSVFRTSEVPDGAVSLERLDWDGQSVELVSGWDTSPGVDMGSEKNAAPDSEKPDWMKSGLSDDELSAIASTGEPAPVVGSDVDIPDFLRQAGWSENTGSFDESAPPIDSSLESEDELERAELPDWVKKLEPEGMDDGELVSEPAAQDDTLGDVSVPDWLQDVGSEELGGAGEDAGGADEEELPDWLGDIEQDTAAPVEEGPGERPTVPPVDLNDLGSSAGEQDDGVAWLESLATKHGAKPEELVSDPEARSDVEPEWVRQAREVGESIQRSMDDETAEKEAEQPADALSDTPPAEVPLAEQPAVPEDMSEMVASTSDHDDALAWLESLETEHVEKPEEALAGSEALEETAAEPEQQISEEPSAEPVTSDIEEKPAVEEPAPEEIEIPAAPPEAAVNLDTLGTSAEEQDDGVAWLESLATKHGAKPEELVTDSESRKETPPEWVRQASEAAASAGAEQESAETDAEPAPVEGTQAGEPDWKEHAREVGESLYNELEELNTEEPTQSTSSGEADTWLQELGSGGFDDTVAPEKDIGDWLQEDWVQEESVEPSTGDEAPVGLPEVEEGFSELESVMTAESGIASELDIEMPEEFRGADENEASVAVEEQPAGQEAEQVDELPDWLAGMEDSVETESAVPSDEPPEWISEEEPLADQPVPTAPDEWQPVTEQEPARLESQPEQPEAQLEQSEAQSEQPELQPEPVIQAPTEMLAEGVVPTKTDHTLNQAREKLSHGNIPAALEEYNKLVKKGKFLDETIYDLREALYRYPVEVSIWQSLGDAYMRDNRLQDALDAYTKAEELLR